MLRVHLTDGRTLCFDIGDAQQAAEWVKRARDYSFQAAVTGLTVQHNGVQYSLPRPVGFREVWFFAESLPSDESQKFKGGERLVCQADGTRVLVMAHSEQKAARVSLSKTGRMVYIPGMEER